MTGNQNSPLGVVELGRYVKRAEARERLGAYLRSLLGEIERRNSWQLAEHQGDTRPYGFQHLINRTRWDEDGVRDAVRQRVHQALRDDDGVVVDETGFLKKGRHSAGVKRQYSERPAGSKTVRLAHSSVMPVAGGRA